MASLNKVMIIGNLGADPEMRYTANGNGVTTFNVATNETFTDRNGAKKDSTEWFTVVCWNALAELCANHLTKGRSVYVEGRLQTRSWEDKDDVKRYRTEVIASKVTFLDRVPGRAEPVAAGRGYTEPDDLPF